MENISKIRAWNKELKEMYDSEIIISLDFVDNWIWIAQEDGDALNVILNNLEVMRYTGYNDKNNREVYEEDFIPYHFDESKIGIVKYGGYKNICDDQHALHIGFYVDWQDEHLKMTCRKDLGFWLKVSEVAGNTFEGLHIKK